MITGHLGVDSEQEERVPQRALLITAAVAVAMAATAATAPAAWADLPSAPAGGNASGAERNDFNGDGVADVATAAPQGTVSGRTGAGYIAVSYGIKSAGLDAAARKVYHQDSPGIPGGAEEGDNFGTALTTGDLDGDGYTDLVAGSPYEDAGTLQEAGSLTVLWGGPGGLSGATVVKGTEYGQYLGEALTAGDFDGDGRPDLATGTTVTYGPIGRTTGPARTETMDVEVGGSPDVLWNRPALAAGDVNGDGISDLLAVVSHGSGELPYHGPRLVQYLEGSRSGLTAARTLKDATTGEHLDGGRAVAVGDLDRDGHAEVVLGRADDEDMRGTDDVNSLGGAVEIVPGSASGPDTRAARPFLHQGTAGVPGTPEKTDEFGGSLSLGDVNGDGRPDLAVGAAGEAVGTAADAGSVTVLLGTASGLTGAGARSFTQSTASVPGRAEARDAFGAAVRLADTNGDGRADLFVGGPGENTRAGGVWVLPAGASQVTGTGSVSFGPGSLGAVAAQAYLGAAFDD
ncbi:FG-GAP and VCBS repeat-containing protein [Streptomyces cadmiisoli]|uniref:FG-GAP and VCBS repeat-containing protein n=1 Tax=Streptomyces cadmiisoli TaxID=2184053 RepID=UPI003656689D